MMFDFLQDRYCCIDAREVITGTQAEAKVIPIRAKNQWCMRKEKSYKELYKIMSKLEITNLVVY